MFFLSNFVCYTIYFFFCFFVVLTTTTTNGTYNDDMQNVTYYITREKRVAAGTCNRHTVYCIMLGSTCLKEQKNKWLYVSQIFLGCVSVLEIELTRLLDKQGVNLFSIFDPKVLPQDVSVDFFLFPVTEPYLVFMTIIPCLFSSVCCRALW